MVLHLRRASDYMVPFSTFAERLGSYFLQQNAAIKSGNVEGVPINLTVLGIGNGLTVRCSGMSQSPTCR
jgi:hypothetical protein